MSFEQVGRLLTAADRLEEMVKALPRWNPQAGERWDEFLERSYEAEMNLANELRRVANCRLTMCSRRSRVDLTLAGISVTTNRGLARACLDWVEEVRATYNGLGTMLGHRSKPPEG
ncbi:hypothetical protein [Rubellimicrobium roseum]|uniref:Uncharacterized protein n=1 Tax=Rubellimicrobium roseum TaxID=687525 RepID=A0A5C4NJB6_9RHOB|nr:hypothetical protein [Rubellimicrobium roseum]TNC74891.1 hypothetical protein FHG71_01810 [Rubellimicrobium roseum]